MKKIIICDFNRTIYDPDKNEIMSNVFETLEKIRARDYYLVLLSQTRDEFRKQLIESLHLERYFHKIVLVPLKQQSDFEKLIAMGVILQKSYSIGDYIEQDIAYAKKNGFRTIRIKSGKFANVHPKTSFEIADYEVEHFNDVLDIVL